MIACAAVLGVVAGTCTGYVIQAGRAPDPLPPLNQPAMAQAGGKGPAPLSAARDRQVRMDGDLRKLLLNRPKGATSLPKARTSDRWVSFIDIAERYNRPQDAFTDLVDAQFRRAAIDQWREGGTMVSVSLTQYRDEEIVASADAVVNHQSRADDSDPTTYSRDIPGSGNGMVYVYAQPDREPGYVPLYQARAFASRGDTMMEVYLVSPRPIDKKRAAQVARQQWERLG
ncbi:hypothetical protein EOT10_35350 [Streptomyces antnestii]|uniref:Uncharacterized protein n=1 Tax=Streptomyces antnestii TaxID=2494256 RepID=A0A437P495_9ACTN|nr:hypothetical protein EOT10_35350 [Streptomyces sp. San01]